MNYLIQKNDEGIPSFFSAKTGQSLGAGGHGWVGEKNHALGFARAQDAQEFIDVFLPHVGPFCTPVPFEFKEN